MIAFYLSIIVSAHDSSGTKGQSHQNHPTKRTLYYQQQQELLNSPQQQVPPPIPAYFPVERTFGDALFYPQMIFGTFLPVAVLIGIGIILAKLFAIGIWALKTTGGGFGGGFPGGFPGGFGGGFGGGYPGFGGGYGGGAGGYGGHFGGGYGGAGYGASGWRSDPGSSSTLSRMLLDKKGLNLPPFLASTISNIISNVSDALEKYEKKLGSSSSSSTTKGKNS